MRDWGFCIICGHKGQVELPEEGEGDGLVLLGDDGREHAVWGSGRILFHRRCEEALRSRLCVRWKTPW